MLESVERDQRQGSSGIRTSEYGSASSISVGMAEAVGAVLMVGRRWCWMAWECLGLRGWFGRPRWPGWLKGTNGTVDMAGTGMAGTVRKCQVHMQWQRTSWLCYSGFHAQCLGVPWCISLAWLIFLFVLTYLARSHEALLVSASVKPMMSGLFWATCAVRCSSVR